MVKFGDGCGNNTGCTEADREHYEQMLEQQKYERDIRNKEISELEEHFAELCVDIMLKKKTCPAGLSIGKYAVVGYNKKGEFMYIGCVDTPAQAWELRDETFNSKSSNAVHGHIIEINPHYFPNILIKKKSDEK